MTFFDSFLEELKLASRRASRVESADLSYPVLTRRVGTDKRELIDGSHRVQKSMRTGQPVKEIIVPKGILRRAETGKESKGKQYASIEGRMVDVEKLWKLTKDFPAKPLDISKVQWRSGKITFPEGEKRSLRSRLEAGKSIFTSRMSAEKGRYRKGEVLSSPFGELVVRSVRPFTEVERHPFLSELTDRQKKQLSGHPFDLVKLEKKR